MISRDHGIVSDESESRWTVNENEIVICLHVLKEVKKEILTSGDCSCVSIENVGENMDLVASDLSLSNFDRDTAAIAGREYLLLDLLKDVKANYDFILIDCPPALGLITYNAMIAADHLVMVTTADQLSYSGLVMVANLFADVKSNERLNKGLKLTGVIVTRFEKNKVSELYLNKIKQDLGQAVIEPVIRKATKMQQAVSLKESIYDLDPTGKATSDYVEVAQQLALRILQA